MSAKKASPKGGGRTGEALGRLFQYANNAVTIIGILLTTASAISIIVFIIGELAGGFRNPYIGIVAYMILPGIFLIGLLVIPLGMWLRRRKLVKSGIEVATMRYPRLDFNDPGLRRFATVVLLLTAINGVLFGTSSYFAVEHLDSVEFCGTSCHLMQPEYTAYQQSPHSRVACVQCHIGPGASWFVRSKIDGLRQVWKTALDTYPRPIPTPLHDLRPARETCEQCHWPAKHYGDKIRVRPTFSKDEASTPSWTVLLLKTGGGRLDLGTHGGIHWWHIYSDNKIRYISDEERENISWVELTTPEGERRIYTRDGDDLPAPEELEQRARTMDCIDCHNRPTHFFQDPSDGLDEKLATRQELRRLPFYKKEALTAIESDSYPSHEAGMEGVRQSLLDYYRSQYPDLWSSQQGLVESGADVAAEVYGKTVFPGMNTDWRTHPNHIGHEDSPGCWRCHDSEMSTADGEHVISQDCDLCHVFLEEDSPTEPDLEHLELPIGS